MGTKFRPLMRKEVKIGLKIEPDDLPVEGNAGDSECEAAVLEKVSAGDMWAWCSVTVTASWRNIEGSDNLGCCSYESEADFMRCEYYADMVERAMAELNSECERTLALLLTHSYDNSLHHADGMPKNGFVDPDPEMIAASEEARRPVQISKVQAGLVGAPSPRTTDVVPTQEAQAAPLAPTAPSEDAARAKLRMDAEEAKKRIEESGTLHRPNASPDQPLGMPDKVQQFGGRAIQTTSDKIRIHLKTAHTLIMGNLKTAINLERPPMQVRLGESALAAHYALETQKAELNANPARVQQEPKILQELQEASNETLERAQRLLVDHVMPGLLEPGQGR